MKDKNTSDRLKYLLAINGWKQVDILEKINNYCKANNCKGLSKSTLSQYISGVYKPDQQKLYILSEALNVSPVWLMGYNVPMEHDSVEELTEEEFFEKMIDVLFRNIMIKLSNVDNEKKKEILDQLAWKLEKASRDI